VDEAFNGLKAEWEALDAGIFPRTPFTSPQWNALWWEYLRRRRPSRDEFYLHTVRDDQRLIAVAPMMVTHVPWPRPKRYRHLQFLGATDNITELRGLACAQADEALALEALSKHFLAHQGDWDALLWSGVRQPSSIKNLLNNSSYVQWERQIPDYCLRLPRTWAEFRTSRKRNIKESLRKCYNSLSRDGHTFKFRVITRAEEFVAPLDTFFALHGARAASDFSPLHPDYFSSAPNRTFLREYARQMALRNDLRIFELEIGGQTVASRIGFVFGNELYLYYSGYLPQWGRYSVMTTLVAETLRWAIESGFSVVNLSPGKDISKTRWGPEETIFGEYVQLPLGWSSRASYRAFIAARSVRKVIRAASQKGRFRRI
jgi:CelD/BcsL family acetyltransferase involved in cellulose biosynthesis